MCYNLEIYNIFCSMSDRDFVGYKAAEKMGSFCK